MTAMEALQALARKFATQKAIVTEECRTMAAAQRLMAKWNETSLNEAISREAKLRACK